MEGPCCLLLMIGVISAVAFLGVTLFLSDFGIPGFYYRVWSFLNGVILISIPLLFLYYLHEKWEGVSTIFVIVGFVELFLGMFEKEVKISRAAIKTEWDRDF